MHIFRLVRDGDYVGNSNTLGLVVGAIRRDPAGRGLSLLVALKEISAHAAAESLDDLAWFFMLNRILLYIVLLWGGAGCVIAAAGWARYFRCRRSENRTPVH